MAEDHNGDGVGVAPLPMRFTKYTEVDFSAGAITHSLLPDTPLVWVQLVSDNAGDELMLPTAGGLGTWPLESGARWPISLTEPDQLLPMGLNATGSASVKIWEF
jgi:hypothetical protein